VAWKQDLKGIVTSLEILPMASLSQVLEDCFPEAIPIPHGLHLDLSSVMEELKTQYKNKLFNTYIENALLLVTYLEKRRGKSDADHKALFECHWRLASCYCHQGNSDQTRRHLALAQAFFDKSGRISMTDWISFRITMAVDMKDHFLYEDAEKLHHSIIECCNKYVIEPQVIGKNAGALSQLLLARKRFEEALKLQNEAISLIDKVEVHRNLRDRALIYTRWGKFDKAAKDFLKAKRIIEEIQEKNHRDGENVYFHWYLAEFFYRKFMVSKPNIRLKLLNDLNELANGITEVLRHPQALVLKFSGLAALESDDAKKSDKALAHLSRALNFFEKDGLPVPLVLAASIRAHRAIFFLKEGSEAKAISDIKATVSCLSVQKDIKNYFNKLIKRLHTCSEQLNNNELTSALLEIIEEIPY